MSGMTKAFVATLLIAGLTFSLAAETPPGIGIGSYKREGIDARAAGMGEAFVAIAEGGATSYFNPAGLAGIYDLNLGGMYSEPYGEGFGVSLQYVSVLGPLGTQTDSVVAGLGVGLMWIGLKVADIPIWGEGGGEGSFSADSSLYLVSLGGPVPGFDSWSAGVSFKYYHSSILEGKANGFGLDVGFLARFSIVGARLTIGVNAMDLGGTTVRWSGTEGGADARIPWVNRVGVAAALFDSRVIIAGGVDWAVGRPLEEQRLRFGGEVRPIRELALRAGWSGGFDGKGGLSFGVGIYLLDSFSIDYAYLPAKAFGATNILSLEVAF